MPFLGKSPKAGNFTLLDSITTSATATYNLTKNSAAYFPVSARNLIVSLNGITQAPDTAYSVSGSTITFASALTSSDVIDYILVLGEVGSLGTPADNTVGTNQIASSIDLSGKTLTFANDQISGDAIDGGTISNFASTGIDDNATSTAITIDSSQNVGIGTTSPNYSLDTSKSIYSGLDTYTGTNYGDIPGFLYLNGDTSGYGIVGSVNSTHKFTLNGGTSTVALITYDTTGLYIQSDEARADFGVTQGTISFKTGSVFTERMRIDSSGNVGIGIAPTNVSAYKTLEIGQTSGTKRGRLKFNTDQGNITLYGFENGTQPYLGIYTDHASGTYIGRFDSDGLKFGNNSAAANALDDYEEGTFTPTLTPSSGSFGSLTYSVRNGFYTKVGNKVTCIVRVTLSALTIGTASGANTITGLPFTPVSAGWSGISVGYAVGWTGYVPYFGYADAGNARVILQIGDWGSNIGSSQPSHLTSSSDIIFTVTYITS